MFPFLTGKFEAHNSELFPVGHPEFPFLTGKFEACCGVKLFTCPSCFHSLQENLKPAAAKLINRGYKSFHSLQENLKPGGYRWIRVRRRSFHSLQENLKPHLCASRSIAPSSFHSLQENLKLIIYSTGNHTPCVSIPYRKI